MVDPDMIDAALNNIALKFEGQYQTDDIHTEYGGWGQFLDGPRPQRQIGLYGTSAGLLVLSLADRDGTPFTEGATNLLKIWWDERKTGYGKSKFCQNPRLAFFALCLRNTPNRIAQKIAEEVKGELFNRASPKGRWGDYWVEKNIWDGSPRYLATALSTFCLSALVTAAEAAQPRLKGACNFLEQTLFTNSSLTSTEKGLIVAALLAAHGSITNRRATREISKLARQPHGTLSENHSYFYEYQYAEPGSSAPHWNRDSVYLYSEIMIGIAGFLPNAPTALCLHAEGILKRVLENISTEGFRPLQGGRISTVEQAWCCVFLALAKQQASRRTRGLSKVHYTFQLQPTWLNLIKVVGYLVIFGLYGPTVVKRLFPGR